ncbi:hypothetical protein JTE90_021444 [Oedothorax gibbosus]|uniref:Uncharacterized protein n=1 Tax=Oedothorax gibbosus TaxID=931172 RepID=A0AAV6VX29_9ARAC|nr:hypothetical protein JTE90_021444 [Oedothorax gibbosus]
MDSVHLLVVLIVISSAKCQGMDFFNGFQGTWDGMGNNDFMKMGGLDSWENFENVFKEMSDHFKEIKPMPNWYDGPNVCTQESYREREHIRINRSFEEYQDHQESENCIGRDFKYVCINRMFVDGKSKERRTTYECCPGFIGSFHNGMKCVKK